MTNNLTLWTTVPWIILGVEITLCIVVLMTVFI